MKKENSQEQNKIYASPNERTQLLLSESFLKEMKEHPLLFGCPGGGKSFSAKSSNSEEGETMI